MFFLFSSILLEEVVFYLGAHPPHKSPVEVVVIEMLTYKNECIYITLILNHSRSYYYIKLTMPQPIRFENSTALWYKFNISHIF